MNTLQQRLPLLQSLLLVFTGLLALVSFATDSVLLPGSIVLLVVGVLPWIVTGRSVLPLTVLIPMGGVLVMSGFTLFITPAFDITLVQVARVVYGSIVLYTIANSARDRRSLNLIILGLMSVGVLLALYALLSVDWSSGKEVFVPGSLFAFLPTLAVDQVHPNVMAGLLVLLLPIAAVLLFSPSPQMLPGSRLLAGVATVLMLLVLVLTQSRGGLLALAVSSGVLLLLFWRWGWMVIAGGLLVFAGLSVSGTLPLVASVFTGSSSQTIAGRVDIWSRALMMIQDFPYTGIGMGSFAHVTDSMYPLFLFDQGTIPHAHNIYLQIAVDLGLPGLIAWLLLVALTVNAAWQVYRHGRVVGDVWLCHLGGALLTSQVALLTHGIFDSVMWGIVRPSMLVWVLWGTIFATARYAIQDRALVRLSLPRWIMVSVASVLVMMLLLAAPTLTARYKSNIAMLGLRDALLARATQPATPSHPREYVMHRRLLAYDVQEQQTTLEHALALQPDSVPIRWALGRLLLATGESPQATTMLEPLCGQGCRNPLLYQDAMVALAHHTGSVPWFEQVITLYETDPPPVVTQTIRDTVALAYLEQDAPDALDRAEQLRPDDLFINYHRWQQAQKADDQDAEATSYEALSTFSFEAIAPTDRRLLAYTGEIISRLVQEDVWSIYTTRQVVSFLVWQYANAPEVVTLLENLRREAPRPGLWLFYLGEVYQRQGNREDAAASYAEALEQAPDMHAARVRLGILAEEQGDLEQAASWYAEYYQHIPHDILVIKRLAVVCTTLANTTGTDNTACEQAVQQAMHTTAQSSDGATPAAVLQQQWAKIHNVRYVIAEALNIAPEAINIGANLLEANDASLDLELSPAWIWLDNHSLSTTNHAVLSHGQDDLTVPYEGYANRITGLWSQPPAADQQWGIGGWIAWNSTDYSYRQVALEPGTPYLIRFVYRTTSSWGHPRLSLGRQTDVLWQGSYQLAKTDGSWYSFMAFGWNDTQDMILLVPFFQYTMAGTVEFMDAEIRSVQLPLSVSPDNTCFWINNVRATQWER